MKAYFYGAELSTDTPQPPMELSAGDRFFTGDRVAWEGLAGLKVGTVADDAGNGCLYVQ